jgi:lipid-A-disaccharide synthase
MTEPLRLFVVAGEASGDRLGADLAQRLKARGVNLSLLGVGGDELKAEGLASLFPMSDLAVMGLTDVLLRLPLLLYRVRQVADAIMRTAPDVAVLIDSQVFTQAVAKRLRKAGARVPLLLYVAPSVWGYRPERAAAIRPLYDEVLGILPMEPEVMQRLGGPPTFYVGHPALERNPMRAGFVERGPLMLLPGSRRGELRRHLGLMRDVAERLHGHPAVDGLVIPTLPSLAEGLRRDVAKWRVPVRVVSGPDRAEAFQRSVAAFAVSGTITLELAMMGIPMVVTYVPDGHQSKLLRAAGVPPIALPSIVAGERLVPELIFTDGVDSAAAVATVEELLDMPRVRQAQVAAFGKIRAQMLGGRSDGPRVDPADRVMAHARRGLLT